MSTAGAEPTAPPPRGTSGGRTNVASQPPATPRTGAQASTRPPEGSGRAQPPSWPAPPPNAMVTAVEARGLSGTPSSRSLPEIIEPRPPRPYDVPLGAPPPVRIDPVPTAAPAAPRTPDIPSVLGRGDALEALARAVRSRFSGALALEDGAGIRRVVMRDGDIVIAASGAEGESLVAFLSERGVLAPDIATRLGHRLPAFGRHAGAALIANGHLRQDELWPVLRAHSEWILGHIVLMDSGGASVERDVPPRLAAEPAAFGGATGAEVLVEIGRRVISPEDAMARLGGADARLNQGPSASLLNECALPDSEVALVQRLSGNTAGEAVAAAPDPAFAAVLLCLRCLGVLEVLGPSPAQAAAEAPAPVQLDALDENAIRQRIVARRALVDEGDYFALLGVSRGATGYDVRRAYLELRRELEPSRLLTAANADLRDDLDLVIEVLDEAYEILRDNARRERYRRALEATPA